jgi:hypothetical protein
MQMDDELKEPIAKAFADHLDAQWRSCQALDDDNPEKLKTLCQPYKAILETVIDALSDKAKNKSRKRLINKLQART